MHLVANVERMGHAVTALDDGSLLVTAGQRSLGSCGRLAWQTLGDVELGSAYATSWTGGMTLREGRLGHSATRLRDGSVLVVGGTDSRTAEVYRPAR